MSKIAIIMPIVVPSQLHFKMTETSIYNLQRFTPPDSYQLVIVQGVENKWTDYLKKILRPNDIYLSFKKNICQPKALNLGISKTNTKYICVFSNDCFVHQNWLEPILEILEKDEADIVGSYWVPVPYQEMPEKEILPVNSFRALGMNAVIMRRELFEVIGKFDERLVQVFWDQDYAIRINQLGLRIAYSKNSLLTSIGSATHLQSEDKETCKFWNLNAQEKEAKIFREKYEQI